jgi:hypothetical protein
MSDHSISSLNDSERSIWEFAFRNALQRFLQHGEWTGNVKIYSEMGVNHDG